MFERFTDRARRVVVLAQEEARQLNHNYVGTEHILIGLIQEGDGVAAQALTALGISLEDARRERDRHRAELAQQHQAAAPALEGRIRRPDEPYRSRQAQLEIRVTDASELVSLAAIFPAGSPATPHGRERLMEQWIQYPEVGNAIIDAGHPARLKVAVSGKPEPFTIQVIAHADRGLKWDRLPVQVTFA